VQTPQCGLNAAQLPCFVASEQIAMPNIQAPAPCSDVP
jgi:hypothetical protein